MNASKEFGVPPQILAAVGMQESGLGRSSNYNPATGTDRDGNQGHGYFQLDPASGASAATLQRAATDPLFAARVAAAMLLRGYKATGDWAKALAIYNSGSWKNPKGQAYAQSVLGQMH